MPITLKYLSHGTYKTGGYRHEHFFAEALRKHLAQKTEVRFTVEREGGFNGIIEHIYLLWLGFSKANANYNIVVGRLALPAIIRNIFSSNKIFIVLHNYDEQDGKTKLLAYYYSLLFWVLKNFKLENVTLVTVAKYWQQYFTQKLGAKNKVAYFPNLFDVSFYNQYVSNAKYKRIHLGQYNPKNHPALFQLAQRVSEQGYECYFSTNDKLKAGKEAHFSIRYERFEDYLVYMGQSEYTLALTGINEGWNRMAHESILVGTQVIGFPKAGLGELLIESGALAVNNIDEAFELIIQQERKTFYEEFINAYDMAKVNVDELVSKVLNP